MDFVNGVELDRIRAVGTYAPGTADRALDGVTRLAATLFGVPMSAVSVIGKDSVYFDGRFGLSAESAPRTLSFCNHLTDGTFFYVPDTHAEARFKNHPFVTGAPNIRFYAAAPIINERGYVLGCLCIIDQTPRTLSEHEKMILTALAQQALALLELRRLNAQMVEQTRKLAIVDKMFALGELASAVSHEINNPLLVIQTQAQRLLDGEAQTRAPETILRMCERIVKITRTLREFLFQGESTASELSSLREIVEQSLEVLSDRIRSERVELRVQCEKSRKIYCNPTLVSQILTNLLANSIDAVSSLETRWIEVNAAVNDGKAVFSVVDSGLAPTGETRERLMEPFFSTKGKAKGLGLGLNLSKRLAESAGGSLSFDGDSVHTRFVLQLPVNR